MANKIISFLKNSIVPYLIAAVAIFFLFRQCNRTAELAEIRQNERTFLKDSISYYRNELGQQVAEKTALQEDKSSLELLLTKNKDSLGQLKRLIDGFKNVDAAGNITTVTKIDTVFIPYAVPIESEFMRKWSKNDKYYSVSGTSTNKGIAIENLTIPNQLSFAIGKKKTGWFSTEYRIEAVNSNPYVQTIGLDGYTLKVPRKRLGLGIYIGYGLGENLTLNPQIGIGISYQLIRF